MNQRSVQADRTARQVVLVCCKAVSHLWQQPARAVGFLLLQQSTELREDWEPACLHGLEQALPQVPLQRAALYPLKYYSTEKTENRLSYLYEREKISDKAEGHCHS